MYIGAVSEYNSRCSPFSREVLYIPAFVPILWKYDYNTFQ